MTRTVAQSEAETYRQVWGLNGYGDFSPGERFAPMFLEMIKAIPGQSVLDAGTGSGKGALALVEAGLNVECCDFTADGLVQEAKHLPFYEVCLWSDLKEALALGPGWGRCYDWVYACDVLEHVPTQFSMLTAYRLLEASYRGVFLSIATVPDAFGAWLGKSLHNTVQPFEWWAEQLSEIGHVAEARDLINTGIYLVTPK